jgi:FtsH-binding integral membrane protein
MQITFCGPPLHDTPGYILLICFVLLILFVGKLPRWAQCFKAIVPAFLVGLYVFFLTGTIILQAEWTFPTVGKIAIQAIGGVTIFILVLIFLQIVRRFASRSAINNSNMSVKQNKDELR